MGTRGYDFCTRLRIGIGLVFFFTTLTPLLSDSSSPAQSSPTASEAFNAGQERCNKHDEAGAIPFFEKAVELNPQMSGYWKWLGYAYYETQNNAKAIDAFAKSLELEENDRYTRENLARAYARNNNRADADGLMNKLLREEKLERRDKLERIGFAYHEGGNDAAAVYWWKRALPFHSTYAARWLAWAYRDGHGVESDQGAALHYRRLAAGRSTLLPRLPNIDYLIEDTNGWILIVAAVLTVLIIPTLTVSAVGGTFAWLIGGEKDLHWTEIARRQFPLRLYFILSPIYLALAYFLCFSYYPRHLLPLSTLQFSLLLLFPLCIAMLASKRLCDRFFPDIQPESSHKLRSIFARVLLQHAPLIIMASMWLLLDPKHEVRSSLALIITILTILWLNYGGLNRMSRWLGWLVEADSVTRDLVHKVARKRQQPIPSIWQLQANYLNALAFPLTNEIWMVGQITQTLTPEELETVIAHEMEHLQEPHKIQLTRLFEQFLFIPFFTLPLWTNSDNRGLGLIISVVIYLTGKSYCQKVTRLMEEKADAAGLSIFPQSKNYAQALEKLYRHNKIPTVLRSKKLTHPDLYDRITAAGVTPEYPRPRPPANWHYLALFITVALNVVAFTIIWLLLF